MAKQRTANIALIDGGSLRLAAIIGAGPSPQGLAFLINHDHGCDWISQDEIAEVVYDPCGKCGRSIVEDGYPVDGESWHLDCALVNNPYV